ncbi:unnamed protein product, partial [Brachionus calyciflorus]
MKFRIFIFIVVIFYTLPKELDALKCYQCADCPSDSTNFGIEENCANHEQFCSKTVKRVMGMSKISRDCAMTCTEGTYHILGVDSDSYCCKDDL